jgi:2-phospho-L-lactate guanylyltransferase
MMERSRTAAVIALKPAEHAKSRLGLPDPLRRRLAWTMALDTLSALSRVMSRVLVVSDQPALEARLRRAGLAVDVIGESGHVGMNPALSHGDGRYAPGDLQRLWPASVIFQL